MASETKDMNNWPTASMPSGLAAFKRLWAWADRHGELPDALADACRAALASPPDSDLSRLQAEADTIAFLEAGVRGEPGVYPGWVYEARDAIRRQNENPPPWLPDLLAALEWQGGTVHDALTAVRRLVLADKERR